MSINKFSQKYNIYVRVELLRMCELARSPTRLHKSAWRQALLCCLSHPPDLQTPFYWVNFNPTLFSHSQQTANASSPLLSLSLKNPNMSRRRWKNETQAKTTSVLMCWNHIFVLFSCRLAPSPSPSLSTSVALSL